MMSKKPRKSANKWTQASELALIALWEDKMNQLRGCRKNSHILVEMVAELQDAGFSYTVIEVKTKMHNLSARYRKEKQLKKRTGGSSEWDLFNEMQALLAPFKSYDCENLVQDSINSTINSMPEDSSPVPSPSPLESAASPLSSPPSSPLMSTASLLLSPSMAVAWPLQSEPMPAASSRPSSSKRAKTNEKESFCNLLQKVENSMENIRKEMKITSESLIKIEEEKKNILKKYVEREGEVQKALVQFLKRP